MVHLHVFMEIWGEPFIDQKYPQGSRCMCIPKRGCKEYHLEKLFSISEIAVLLEFLFTNIYWVYRNWSKKDDVYTVQQLCESLSSEIKVVLTD